MKRHCIALVFVSISVFSNNAFPTDWETCPPVPNRDYAYNVLVLIKASTSDQADKDYNEAGRKLENWCYTLSKVSSTFDPGDGYNWAVYYRCNDSGSKPKNWSSSFPSGPGKFIHCGRHAAAKNSEKTAVPSEEIVACSASDIEGNWKRGDGASIVLNGMNLKDGGRALMFNNPSGWPAGVFKFSSIKQKSGCEFQAVCQTVHRNSAGGGYNTSKESCTLVVDKKAGTLKAPGSHGSYKR